MITSILSGDFDPIMLLLRIPIVLLSLSLHECAHGYAAYKMGDPTAKIFGRITLNPLKHLDVIGTLCMFLFGFGWAKPVPVNARKFNNPKKGMAITAAAGPISNVLLAFAGLIIYNVIYESYVFFSGSQFAANLWYVLLTFFISLHYMNLSLAIFNLLPIPPLDGSRLAFVFLSDEAYFKFMKYEQIIQIIIMVALFTGILDTPLTLIVSGLSDGMQRIINLIIGLFV
ncbi:MAG: site-2 protease family protein [Clostridia bacterium]|nr:site-2 protease family protein [Clostridia bacterium]